jgi:hypothetical protein
MKPVLVVRARPEGARAELRRAARVLWAGEVECTTADEFREVVVQLITSNTLPCRPASLRIELDGPLAQVRTLRGLPPVRRAHLQALVATQAGRFFRRNGIPLATDAAWDGPGSRGSDRTAIAAAVEESWIEAILDAAATVAVRVEAIRPTALPAGVALDLVSAAERRRRGVREGRRLRRLAAVAVMSWLLAAAVLAFRLHRARSTVEREIDALRQPAEALAAARRALDEGARLVEALAAAEHGRGRALRRVTAISGVLPDSSFVTSLVLAPDGNGELSVVARRSGQVLAGLGRSPAIVSPELVGSVVREASGGVEWEHFSVRFGGEAP